VGKISPSRGVKWEERVRVVKSHISVHAGESFGHKRKKYHEEQGTCIKPRRGRLRAYDREKVLSIFHPNIFAWKKLDNLMGLGEGSVSLFLKGTPENVEKWERFSCRCRGDGCLAAQSCRGCLIKGVGAGVTLAGKKKGVTSPSVYGHVPGLRHREECWKDALKSGKEKNIEEWGRSKRRLYFLLHWKGGGASGGLGGIFSCRMEQEKSLRGWGPVGGIFGEPGEGSGEDQPKERGGQLGGWWGV